MDKFPKLFSLTNLTLITALTLSCIAAWYSVLGLTAIFAAAVIPIIIMGGALEIAKVVTTVWLHKYWHKAKWTVKLYLSISVVALAFLTSMGIFGFLSKAHLDQNIVSGDVQAKIAIYDEKIKIAKDNIDANRKALKQMDEAVDQVMGRSTTEQGAERSVQIRRQQGPERQRLIREIEAEQKKITELNEARAPIAAEVRKVEAEVGPIKYIAALIYDGDNPDANLLEKAVRWVIILIIFVFDPLALTLVIAATSSRKWDKETAPEEKQDAITHDHDDITHNLDKRTDDELDRPNDILESVVSGSKQITESLPEPEKINCIKCDVELVQVAGLGLFCPNKNCELDLSSNEKEEEIIPDEIREPKRNLYSFRNIYAKNDPVEFEIPEFDSGDIQEEVTEDIAKDTPEKVVSADDQDIFVTDPLVKVDGDYAVFQGKSMSLHALSSLHPELGIESYKLQRSKTGFGTEFPKIAASGEIFVRVDVLPNKVFKFNGSKWIEVNRENTDTYLYDVSYIKFLIEKIEKGEYDIDLLSENEKVQIEEYLKSQNS